jgi:uncharacterized protein
MPGADLAADECLGIGIGLRRAFAEELLRTPRAVDWLEITPENWMGRGGRDRWLLDACAERWPIVPHAVSLSIGGPDLLDDELLDGVTALVRRLRAPWWSDHLAFSRAHGTYLQDLLPLPFSEEAVEHVTMRLAEVEHRVGVPLLLENITYYGLMPGSTMDEPAFVQAVLAASGANLLLDVNNLWVNAQNHGQDARAVIDRLPMERLGQLHLGGHTRAEGRIVDTHAAPVSAEVWDLYAHTLARAGRLVPTLIEWDAEIPSLDRVLDEVDRARSLARWALTCSTEAGAGVA